MLHRIAMASVGLLALTGAAFAADLPVKAPPLPPPPPIFSWAGFYIGGQVGWGRAHDDGRVFNPGIPIAANNPFSISADGVIGGGHIGYNLQYGQWVIGVEGTVDGSNLNKAFVLAPCPFCGNATTDIGIQGSVRGQLGIAFDRMLFYATGGVAIADITNTYDTTAIGGAFASIGGTRVGWTAGVGGAYAFTDNWSARIEYRHSDFGDVTDKSNTAFFPATDLNRHVTEDQVQVGFSYRLR